MPRGRARIIAATGVSQFEFLDALTVEMFHLDEYIGLPASHPASFRKYLRERLIGKTGIERHHLLDGEGEIESVVAAVGRAIAEAPIDVAFVGINTEAPYLVVELDEACRRQQVGEGWFATLADVPQRALTMSIRQILKAQEILCVVPDARKATAVKACLEGPVSNLAPASILQTHPRTTLYLDPSSAALLERRPEPARS